MSNLSNSLTGRVALVTGASRRTGIGFAIARKLARLGADVFAHSFMPFDDLMPWGADRDGMAPMLSELRSYGGRVGSAELDLREVNGPQRLIDIARRELGHLDILVLNHSHGVSQSLEQLTAEEIDKHFQINVRAGLLLIKGFAAQHDGIRGGRIITLTSGQSLVPMPAELPYIASKGAIQTLTLSLSAHLAAQGITINSVDPGATDTGYATPEQYEEVRLRNPQGRWGSPEDAARVICWLASDDASWITGQVIHSTGGS